MAIAIELLDSGSRTLDIKVFEGDELCIGRDFNCDFVVSDPHVDPQHCRIFRSSESSRFTVCDDSTINGTYIHRRALKGAQATLESGSVFKIGKTRIRIIDPDLPIVETLKLDYFDQITDAMGRASISVPALVLVGLIAALDAYQHSNAMFRMSHVLAAWLSLYTVILATTGFWALVGRVSTGKANIPAHAAIACTIWLLMKVWELFLFTVLYNYGGMGAGDTLVSVSSGLIFLFGQFLHLRLASHLNLRYRLAIIAAIFLVNPGITLYRSVENSGEFSSRVQYAGRVFPPSWHVSESSSRSDLVKTTKQTFEAAREEVLEMKLKDAREHEHETAD